MTFNRADILVDAGIRARYMGAPRVADEFMRWTMSGGVPIPDLDNDIGAAIRCLFDAMFDAIANGLAVARAHAHEAAIVAAAEKLTRENPDVYERAIQMIADKYIALTKPAAPLELDATSPAAAAPANIMTSAAEALAGVLHTCTLTNINGTNGPCAACAAMPFPASTPR